MPWVYYRISRVQRSWWLCWRRHHMDLRFASPRDLANVCFLRGWLMLVDAGQLVSWSVGPPCLSSCRSTMTTLPPVSIRRQASSIQAPKIQHLSSSTSSRSPPSLTTPAAAARMRDGFRSPASYRRQCTTTPRPRYPIDTPSPSG